MSSEMHDTRELSKVGRIVKAITYRQVGMLDTNYNLFYFI